MRGKMRRQIGLRNAALLRGGSGAFVPASVFTSAIPAAGLAVSWDE
jgi:hypothetical protein